MTLFKMLQGTKLRCSGRKLFPFTLCRTEDEAEIVELRQLQKEFGVCEEVLPPVKETPKAEEKKTVDPEDDISLVKGVGKKGAEKLALKGITTKSALKAALAKDRTKLEDALDPLSMNKVAKFFEDESKPKGEAKTTDGE